MENYITAIEELWQTRDTLGKNEEQFAKRKCIIDDILFKSRNCYPYERTYDNDDENNKYNRINLRFYEQGASTLRTIYNKIRHRFFEKEQVNDIIVTNELRYIKHIIYASYLLLKKIDPKKYNETNKEDTLKELKILVKDKTFQAHNAERLIGVDTDTDEKSSKSSKSSFIV